MNVGELVRVHWGNCDWSGTQGVDWGYAPDYVEGMWRILQHDVPEDFVLATGKNFTVRQFVDLTFKELGIELEWVDKGIDEKGIDKASGVIRVKVDPSYYRPTEVETLLGDATKAKEKLGWSPTTSFKELVKIMIESDLEKVRLKGY